MRAISSAHGTTVEQSNVTVANQSPRATEELAVVFLDMSGFTALTEVHGDYAAATLAEDFTDLTSSLISGEDRLVKSIGDAVLFVSPSARGALRSLSRIIDATHQMDRYPLLRGGIAYGPVLTSHGDVYGRTVNIAARLVAVASPGQTVADRAVAEAAANEGIAAMSLGQTTLHNLPQPVEIFAIAMDSDCHCGRIDPVCRMRLSSDTVAVTRSKANTAYRFCSAECAQRFVAGSDQSAVALGCPRDAPSHNQSWQGDSDARTGRV